MTNPFAEALKTEAHDLAPLVHQHLVAPVEPRLYRGTMNKVRRVRGWKSLLVLPVLCLAARQEMLFPESGADIPFTLQQDVVTWNSRTMLEFVRIFHFPKRTRCFSARMYYDCQRQKVIDHLGKSGWLEVELHPKARNGSFLMNSGRQSVLVGPIRLPLPAILCGHAAVEEWQTMEGKLGIKVQITNPMIGEIFFYEGTFEQSTN